MNPWCLYFHELLKNKKYLNIFIINKIIEIIYTLAGDKNISILHLSYMASDLQFSLVLQAHALVLYVYAMKNKREK